MRLLIELRGLADCVYDLRYYHKLQGFLYGLLEGTPYAGLHDGLGYKFFCFSNIFPPQDFKRGDVRHLMISNLTFYLRQFLGAVSKAWSPWIFWMKRRQPYGFSYSLVAMRAPT